MSETNDMRLDFEAWFSIIQASEVAASWTAWQAATERATAIERERCARICEDISDANLGNIELDAAEAAIRQGGAG